MKINKNDYTIVAKELTNELIRKITGDDEDWLFGKTPSEHVMIGMIDAQSEEESILKGEEIDNKKFDSIPSIGIRFRVQNQCEKVFISLKGKLFYRTRPTYQQQIEYILQNQSKKTGIHFVDIESLKHYITNKKQDEEYVEEKESIVKVYKSISLSSLGTFELNLHDLKNSIDSINLLIDKK